MIHDLILHKVQEELQRTCIDELWPEDKTRAGVVMIGPLQGNPDPDVARISITVHENDPDRAMGGVARTRIWQDEIISIEMGNGRGVATWSRKFSVKARCLLESTREEIVEARDISSTLRSRIEETLRNIDFNGVGTDAEYVSQGVMSFLMKSETLQSGGPPDAFDFHTKVKFEIWTTERS